MCSDPDGEIGENFGMSQFWYTDETSDLLAMEAITLGITRSLNYYCKRDDLGGTRVSGQHARIACVSCPSVFQSLRRLDPPDTEFVILEFDKRFSVYGEKFFEYDFNNPTYLPQELFHAFDFVIADPPYLNKDCMSQTGSVLILPQFGMKCLC